MIELYADMGRQLADRWGYKNKDAKDLSDEQRIVCLLAAVVSKLDDLVGELRSSREMSTRAQQKAEPVDGMLLWMNAMSANQGPPRHVATMDKRKLSMRARRALYRLGVEYNCEITREALTGIPGCGEVTIAELLEWAK